MKIKVIIFLSIIIISLSLVGYKSKSSKILNEGVFTTSQFKINDLLRYKGSYVGDNSSVKNVLANLPANEFNAGFILKTNKHPYAIIINYKANKSVVEDNYYKFWSSKNINEFLEKNAVVLLSLINNADIVEFNVDGISDQNFKYNRKILEGKYGCDLKNLFKDDTSFQKFLNNL